MPNRPRLVLRLLSGSALLYKYVYEVNKGCCFVVRPSHQHIPGLRVVLRASTESDCSFPPLWFSSSSLYIKKNKMAFKKIYIFGDRQTVMGYLKQKRLCFCTSWLTKIQVTRVNFDKGNPNLVPVSGSNSSYLSLSSPTKYE